MDSLILPLNEIGLQDAPLVGRKAAALGTMSEAGFPVPAGFCITANAFFQAFDPFFSHLQSILSGPDLSDPYRAEAASHQITGLLSGLALPGLLAGALEKAIASLPELSTSPLAVRSSATLEDSDRASFAGQYLSRIGVCGREALHTAILDVWRSFYSPHALSARAKHESTWNKEAMAVLIQPAVDAECAGVCFTVDPVNPDREQLVINAAWGLGTGVAEGTVAADTAWLRRKDLGIEARRIVQKYEQVRLDPELGLKRVPLPPEMVRSACLPDNWSKRVAEFSLAAELLFGPPQDVEWAIAGGQVWLLQSRPLTTLPPERSVPAFPIEWDDPQDRFRMWRMVPLHDGRPMLPLESDYVEPAAASKQESAIFSGEAFMVHVKFFTGRPYFCRIPSGLGPGDQRVRQAMMQDLDRRLRDQGQNTWDYWGPEVIAAVKRLGAFDLAHASGPALADHLEDTQGALRRHWVVHAQVWSPAFAPLRAAYAALTGRAEDEVHTEVVQMLHGEDSALTRLIDGLYELAETARQSPALAGFVASPPPDPLARLAELRNTLPHPEGSLVAEFSDRFERFLESYGDRTGKGFGSESTLLTPNWREDPGRALRLAAPYLDPTVESPATARHRAREESEARLEALCQEAADPEKAADFRMWLGRARRDAVILEEHNYYIDQISDGLLHAACLAAGNWLAARGDLSAKDEVFWLRAQEISAALRSPEPAPFKNLIENRKAQHARWMGMAAPPILGLPEAALDDRPPFNPEQSGEKQEQAGRIAGQGASPGCSTGRARVIPMSAVLPDLAPGDILVAENAGPLWTPFFPILGGLVLDGGALGQHAAAAAREYGVPAVIGANNATRRILDGRRVRVDGTRGIVEIIEQE